ncbi:MAG: hypothetical protein ACLU0O_08105 [Collinsella sp.]
MLLRAHRTAPRRNSSRARRAPERGYVDRRHQRRGGLGRSRTVRRHCRPVARQRVGHERVEPSMSASRRLSPGEYPDRDVLAGRQAPSERDEASSASQSLLAPAAAPRPGGAREPAPAAAEHPAAPPNSPASTLPAARRVDRALERGSASSRVARSLFFARVLADDANSRCDDRIRSEASLGSRAPA